jgi:hypothetical protein
MDPSPDPRFGSRQGHSRLSHGCGLGCGETCCVQWRQDRKRSASSSSIAAPFWQLHQQPAISRMLDSRNARGSSRSLRDHCTNLDKSECRILRTTL